MNKRLIPHLVIVFHTFFKNLQPVCLLALLAVIFLHLCHRYGTVNLNVGVLKFLFLLVVEDQKDQTCLSNT